MDLVKMKSLIEAVIFASPEPVDLQDLTNILLVLRGEKKLVRHAPVAHGA
mgnify:CR=1 FL=1